MDLAKQLMGLVQRERHLRSLRTPYCILLKYFQCTLKFAHGSRLQSAYVEANAEIGRSLQHGDILLVPPRMLMMAYINDISVGFCCQQERTDLSHLIKPSRVIVLPHLAGCLSAVTGHWDELFWHLKEASSVSDVFSQLFRML